MDIDEILDDSLFEIDEDIESSEDSEYNEDNCYEFGGTLEDNKTRKKTVLEKLKKALPILTLIFVLCAVVLWYAINF